MNLLQSILIGNGLHQLHDNGFSWNKLLETPLKEDSTWSLIPNIHKFEYNVFKKDVSYSKHVDKVYEKEKKRIIENIEKLNSKFGDKTYPSEYDTLISMEFDHYMTTNYDNALEDAIVGNGYSKDEVHSDTSENRYNIRRKKAFKKGNKNCTFWQIHGEMSKPNSIMLGYYHYCSSLTHINSYLRTSRLGKTPIDSPGFEKERDNEFILWKLKHGYNDMIDSWVDLFFFTDVHILGFGMDFSELDLWYILNKRKLLLSSEHKSLEGLPIIRNKIYFYGDPTPSVTEMLQAYDVEIISSEKKKSWKEFYSSQMDNIQKKISSRKQHSIQY